MTVKLDVWLWSWARNTCLKALTHKKELKSWEESRWPSENMCNDKRTEQGCNFRDVKCLNDEFWEVTSLYWDDSSGKTGCTVKNMPLGATKCWFQKVEYYQVRSFLPSMTQASCKYLSYLQRHARHSGYLHHKTKPCPLEIYNLFAKINLTWNNWKILWDAVTRVAVSSWTIRWTELTENCEIRNGFTEKLGWTGSGQVGRTWTGRGDSR